MNESQRPSGSSGSLSRAARALTLGWSDTRQGRLALRRAAGGLLRLLLRLRSRTLPGNAVRSALVIAPHPDDETFGCGGAVALLVRGGAAVHVAFVTDGGASHPDHPSVGPVDMAVRRREEARLATGILGVDWSRVSFLDERDGTLGDLDAGGAREAAGKIAAVLARLGPGAVLLPCRLDGSSEHKAAFALVSRALQQAGLAPRMLEYPVWSWWNPLLLLGPLLTSRRVWRFDLRDVLDQKARAIASYASQTEPIAPETTPALPAGFASLFLCGEEFLFER